jgi:integral membrane sensor domain MASE1/two-component sensor histidine kinase
MDAVLSPSRASAGLAAAGTGAAYYLLARIGYELALPGAASCPIWPAAGTAMAAAVVLGPAACVGILVGGFLARPDLAGLGAALGSALQALAGATLLDGAFAGPEPLSRCRNVVRFAALTPILALIGATAGAASLAAGNFPEAWLTWWLGDVVSILLALPLVFAWRPRDTDELGEPLSPVRALKAAAVTGLLWLSVWLGFGDFLPAGLQSALGCLPYAALLWVTLRFETRGAAAGAAILAALVQWHTARGLGPFASGRGLNEALLLSSVYVAAAGLTAFLLRALLAELGEARAELERRMHAQGDDLWTANAHLRVAALGRREDGRRIQLYRRIFAEVPVGLAVLRIERPEDPESWLIVEFNPSGLRLSGAGDENPAGRRLLDFAPDLRGSEVTRACAEALRLDRPVAIPDYASRGRAGGGRFSLNIFPLGAPFVGVAFENITARKSAEEALARSNSELSQFAYVASHDLQAPLRKISAFAEQLRQRLAAGRDETSLDFLTRIGRSAAGMQDLIEALLELARVEASSEEPREVRLAAVAAEVLDELDDAIARAGARVEVGPLPSVMGDPAQLRRLLHNLVGNALKFAAPGRAPRVRLRGGEREGGLCELVVEDDGVGFEMEFAARLFQPFQRLHSRNDYPGSGMGLAICRKIVERHGGAISAQSAPGRGARFTAVFPSIRTAGRGRPALVKASA